ncbi:MAG: NADH-quinone oxidoreductase subunit NuoH [Acidimicrobiia bacterium]|nr:NADH-quinone oxidoreductase subunit NuoH [Acidimicrobiia bacterium]
MNFFLLSLIKVGLVAAVLMTTLAYLQWVERKVIAHIQLRVGPSRVGPHGLLQPLADVIKLITKEDLIPAHVNKFFYLMAPILAVALALTSISVIPFGPQINVFGVETYMQLTDLNIGVLVLLAISGLSVYGIALAGWASNNKYALLGGLRASAQMISYELPLALAIASPLLLHNSLSLREIVNAQDGYYFGFLARWAIFQMPMPQIFAFILFMIGAFAETNRIPFDLPEAENELVAGFHTEYSSMKFAAFFMAEYANMITICALATILFLGGWHPPFPVELGSGYVPSAIFGMAAAIALFHGLNPARPKDRFTLPVFAIAFFGLAIAFAIPVLNSILLPLFWFASKTGFLLFLFIWVRGTLPRFRYDQLMRFAWAWLFPVSVVHLFATGLLVALYSN